LDSICLSNITTKIKFGLFNKNGYIKEETEGKAIQGFLPDGKVVYFDINKSNDKPHIYIDNRFMIYLTRLYL